MAATTVSSLLKSYYYLAKPGIVRGNAITATAGFFLAYNNAGSASNATFDTGLLLATVGGLSLVIASACVSNNYIDRDIDKQMARTKQRSLATGTIPDRNAIAYATVLGLLGSAVLGIYTNYLTLALAVFGFLAYVALYGIAKRRTVHGTVIGSISGAVPPVVGYTAVAGQIDTAAILLFLILVVWQMPHFYAIAMYRAKDYAAANIPVLPVVQGMPAARRQILLYIIAFTVIAPLLTVFGYTGLTYMIVSILLGLTWLGLGLRNGLRNGLRTSSADIIGWARRMFLYSLLVITILCIAITFDGFLP